MTADDFGENPSRRDLRAAIADAVARTSGVEDLCTALSAVLTSALRVASVQVFLYEPLARILRLVTLTDSSDAHARTLRPIPVSPDGRSLNERALATRRLAEPAEADHPRQRLPQPDGTNARHALASAPLVFDGDVLGTMVLFSESDRRLEPEEREALETVAADVSPVLARRVLIERLRVADAKTGQRDSELLTGERIRQSFINSLDRSAILKLLAEALIATYSMDYVLVLTTEPDGRLVAQQCVERNSDGVSWTWRAQCAGTEVDERFLAPEGLSQRTVPSLLAGLHPTMPGGWQFEVLPIENEQVRFGVVVLGWRSPTGYTSPDEASTVRTILDETAIALDHAQIVGRLRALDSMKNEFLAVISHELRTPLTAILGFAETLLSAFDPPLSDEAQEFVLTIRDQGRMLLVQIENLLELSQLETGLVSLDCTWVELGELLLEATSAISKLPKSDAVAFRMSVADETLAASVWVDQPRIVQAIRRLLENAAKFTEQGEIDLRAEADAQSVRIIVADTGQGIPPDDLPHLFDRFYQGDRGNTRRVRGVGLGLCIVRHIVELHGGRVGVRSELGKGSEFWIALPRAGKVRGRTVGSE